MQNPPLGGTNIEAELLRLRVENEQLKAAAMSNQKQPPPAPVQRHSMPPLTATPASGPRASLANGASKTPDPSRNSSRSAKAGPARGTG